MNRCFRVQRIKKEALLNRTIYLPEYFSGSTVKIFSKELDYDILYWDFIKELDEIIKQQMEILLNQIMKTFKSQREERNRYLKSLTCLFCHTEILGLKDISQMEKSQEQEYVNVRTALAAGKAGSMHMTAS